MAMVGVVLDDRREWWLVGVAAVEVPVAPAGGALDGGRVAGGGRGGRHELAAAVERMAAEARRMVLQAFLVCYRSRGGGRVDQVVVVVSVVVVALEDSVGE